MRRTKRSNQLHHAAKRASERFGIRLHQDLITRLVRGIHAGKWPLVERQSNRVALYAVTVDEIPVHAVYDRNRKTIVTLLRPEWKTQGHGHAH